MDTNAFEAMCGSVMLMAMAGAMVGVGVMDRTDVVARGLAEDSGEGMRYKLLDLDRKGNVVRFFLGAVDAETWWGDDWDDAPYEHNAGKVYMEYVVATLDVAFDFDAVVVVPSDGESNSPWSKHDMQMRRVPMLDVLKVTDGSYLWLYEDWFAHVNAHGDTIRVWMGSVVDVSDVTSWLGPAAHVLSLQNVGEDGV
jgi:hypothetical protein